jgi:transposase-like protein
MDKTISKLRERIEQSRKSKGGHRMYRAELRDDIVKLALAWTSRGKPLSELGRRLEIHRDTLKYWLQSQSRDAQRNARMRPVRVVETEPASAAPPTVTRSLLLPSGARVEGVTMDELITLARALA